MSDIISLKKIVSIFVGVEIFIECLECLYSAYKTSSYYRPTFDKLSSADAVAMPVTKVLIFPGRRIFFSEAEQRKDLKRRLGLLNPKIENSPLNEVIGHLDTARESIDVCVLLLTSRPLLTPLIRAKERGVKVRVLLDRNLAKLEHSKLSELRRNNIQVRLHKGTNMMHHKFALVDSYMENFKCLPGKGFLLSGSCNWTASAMTCNHENMIITDCPGHMYPYVEEFKSLWELAE